MSPHFAFTTPTPFPPLQKRLRFYTQTTSQLTPPPQCPILKTSSPKSVPPSLSRTPSIDRSHVPHPPRRPHRHAILVALAALVSLARPHTARAAAVAARLRVVSTRLSARPAAAAAVAAAAGHGLGGTSFTVAASAALLASSFAVALTHPIDTLKTLRQAGTNNEPLGVRRLYKGVLSNILKEAPNAAIYLACYELFKSWLLRIPVFAGVPLLAMCVAGMLGDAVGSVVRVPAEIINKRLQLGLSSSWSSAIRDGFMSESGVQGTIASWEAVLWRDVPYGGLQIAGYEAVRMLLMRFGLCGLALSIVAGAVAGWIAAVVTTPADVLVTRMSTQRPQCYLETKHYMSPIATFTRIWRDEGFAALWTGATHRGLFYMPMIALFFAAYETFKFVIMNPHRARQIVLAAVLSFAKAGLVNAEAFAAAFHVPLYVAALVVAHSIVAGRGKRTAV